MPTKINKLRENFVPCTQNRRNAERKKFALKSLLLTNASHPYFIRMAERKKKPEKFVMQNHIVHIPTTTPAGN